MADQTGERVSTAEITDAGLCQFMDTPANFGEEHEGCNPCRGYLDHGVMENRCSGGNSCDCTVYGMNERGLDVCEYAGECADFHGAVFSEAGEDSPLVRNVCLMPSREGMGCYKKFESEDPGFEGGVD